MIDQERFGLKELNSVVIRAYSDMKIGNTMFKAGEPVLYFEKIQIGELSSGSTRIVARGGWGNFAKVIWDQPNDVTFSFTEGVMSRMSLSILANAGLYDHRADGEILQVSKKEELTVRSNKVTLSQTPLQDTVFCYLLNTEGFIQDKITNFSVLDNIVMFDSDYNNQDIVVDYRYNYDSGFSRYIIGDKGIDGFLTLEAKAYMKSENDGINRTFLLEMPKIKITSNLEIVMGEKASPTVSVFNIIGVPIKENGHFTVCRMNLLEEDIDSDI